MDLETRLLEREEPAARLRQALSRARAGRGSLAVIAGEAGIGKSALLRGLLEAIDEPTLILEGYCDDLATPRVLGPFRDVARSRLVPGLAEAVQAADADGVLDGLMSAAAGAERTVILAVEDVHWADEASLDVLRSLARRADRLRLLIVVTMREIEAPADHPARRLLQPQGSSALLRIDLSPLGREAVLELMERFSRPSTEAGRMLELTAGNPFFLTEVLLSDGAEVPSTVAGAVLARLRTLSPSARAAAELLSMEPGGVHLREGIGLTGEEVIDELVDNGLLDEREGSLLFRHELARRALADAVPPARRIELHRSLAEHLRGRPDTDPARLLHHAAESGWEELVAQVGPVAVDRAVSARSHREALSLLTVIVDRLDDHDPEHAVEMRRLLAYELYFAGATAQALAEQHETVAVLRRLDVPLKLADALVMLGRISWVGGDRPGADAAIDEALQICSAHPSGARTAMRALAARSSLLMLVDAAELAVPDAQRAMEIASELHDDQIRAHAMNTLGVCLWRLGREGGRELLVRSRSVAAEAAADDDVCRSWINEIWQLVTTHQNAEAARLMPEARAAVLAAEGDGYLAYLDGSEAIRRLQTGDHAGALRLAEQVLSQGFHASTWRLPALQARASVLVRTGRDGADEALQDLLSATEQHDELQRRAPAARILAEHAWAAGDPELTRQALQRLDDAADLSSDPGAAGIVAELRIWMRRLGAPAHEAPSEGAAGRTSPAIVPSLLCVSGEHRQATEAWRRLGQPYEAAMCLWDTGSPPERRVAAAEMERLGALPAAARITARLTEDAGSSEQTGAPLTPRQTEVLELIAEGLTNAEIAARMVLSVRTVDHHVAAVLGRLGVASRRDAARLARRLRARSGER